MTWLRFFLGCLLALNLLLAYRLLFTNQGYFAYRELTTHYEDVAGRIEELKQENVRLSREIRLLKDDREYIEKMIREQMQFVKDGEILYVFPRSANATDRPGDDETTEHAAQRAGE